MSQSGHPPPNNGGGPAMIEMRMAVDLENELLEQERREQERKASVSSSSRQAKAASSTNNNKNPSSSQSLSSRRRKTKKRSLATSTNTTTTANDSTTGTASSSPSLSPRRDRPGGNPESPQTKSPNNRHPVSNTNNDNNNAIPQQTQAEVEHGVTTRSTIPDGGKKTPFPGGGKRKNRNNNKKKPPPTTTEATPGSNATLPLPDKAKLGTAETPPLAATNNNPNEAKTTLKQFGKKFSKPCRDFLRGNCSYGNKCRFLHENFASNDDNNNSNQAEPLSPGTKTVPPATATCLPCPQLPNEQVLDTDSATKSKSSDAKQAQIPGKKRKKRRVRPGNTSPGPEVTAHSPSTTNNTFETTREKSSSLVSGLCGDASRIGLMDLTTAQQSQPDRPPSPAVVSVVLLAWTCPACSLENENQSAIECQVCGTPRPENENAWYCTSCTFLNQEESDGACAVCQQPRLLSSITTPTDESDKTNTDSIANLDKKPNHQNNLDVSMETNTTEPPGDEMEPATHKTRETSLDTDEDARAEYRKARNAAKKARRQQERLAKLQEEEEDNFHSQPNAAVDVQPPESVTKASYKEEYDCEEKKEEPTDLGDEAETACLTASVSNEVDANPKKAKKNKRQRRFEMRMQELDNACKRRDEFWQSEIDDRVRTVNLLVLVCATEIARLEATTTTCMQVLQDAKTKKDLVELSRPIYTHLYGSNVNVMVAGMTQQHQHFNDRKGKIEHYDAEKGKFYVALETRKGVEYTYFAPCNLERQPNPAKKKTWTSSFAVRLSVGLLEIEKEIVDKLRDIKIAPTVVGVFGDWMADSRVSRFLDDWAVERTRQEEAERRAMEEEERRYENMRREAAERRRREEEEWQRQKAEFARRKAEYDAWEKEAKKQPRQTKHDQFCSCPACDLRRIFMFYSACGGDGFDKFFYYEEGTDDEYDYDYFEDYFDRQHEAAELAKVQEAAETLGVTEDATLQEVRKAYHRKARKYHPDSYSADDHADGMTKKQAEDHFKKIADAYEAMVSYSDKNSDY